MRARGSWLFASLALLAGCTCRAQPPVARALPVFAAASLREAFVALERGFERRAPDVDVQLAFAGSQVLRMQIEQGARAGVFASAHIEHVEALAEQGLLAPPQVFATNELALIVPSGSALRDFSALPTAERVVLGSGQVPVGVYARQLLRNADTALGEGFERAVMARVVSEESNVRLVRAKVELREADAALVYASDAAASRRVRRVPIPEAVNVHARYAIAAIAPERSGSMAAEGARFVRFVRSAEGQRLLRQHGLSGVGAP